MMAQLRETLNEGNFNINFVPPRPNGFAGAGCGQDQKFKCPRSHSLLCPQCNNEGAYLAIGQRGVMVDLLNLGALWQLVFEISFGVMGGHLC